MSSSAAVLITEIELAQAGLRPMPLMMTAPLILSASSGVHAYVVVYIAPQEWPPTHIARMSNFPSPSKLEYTQLTRFIRCGASWPLSPLPHCCTTELGVATMMLCDAENW